jgi:hypothetical protein
LEALASRWAGGDRIPKKSTGHLQIEILTMVVNSDLQKRVKGLGKSFTILRLFRISPDATRRPK